MMNRVIHYHHPQAENFSLKYSSAAPKEVLARLDDLDSAIKFIGYPFDTPVYVLYESGTEIEAATDIEFDEEWFATRIAELPRDGQVVAFRLVELLEAAVDVQENDEFRLYKDFEPQKIQQALDHVSWGTAVPQVAGELMSNLILPHHTAEREPPNRHRDAPLLYRERGAELRDAPTHIDDETWQEWVNPYIVDSKQLITVRRNNLWFKQLEELGVDFVERKDGIRIRLAEFELNMHRRDALSTYARRHEEHCTAFAHAVLKRVARAELLDRSRPTRQAFIKYLESGLIERDFREMF